MAQPAPEIEPDAATPAQDTHAAVVLTVPGGRGLVLWLKTATPGAVAGEAIVEDEAGACVARLSGWHRTAPDRLAVDLPESAALPRWSLDRPTFCRLRGDLTIGDASVHLDQRFAYRWLAAREGTVRLNDRPLYLRGAIRGITAHDTPNVTGLPDAQWHEKLIRRAKAFGFNLIRWHSTVPNAAWLDACDRLGMLNQIEMGFEKVGDAVRVDAERWERIIRDTCRHPSVGVYCIGNEIRRAGSYPHVQALVRRARELAPATLATDSAGWGQPDRPEPDLYVQHVAYFFPFAEHADMFDRLEGFELEGRVRDDGPGSAQHPLRPTLAHEVCHYIAIRDLDRVERGWRRWRDGAQPAADHPAAELPWWVEGTRQLVRDKDLADELDDLRRASQRFQALGQRHMLEQIRLSPRLQGYQMLQLIDCWKYENSNGLIDVFGEPIHWDPDAFRRFNGDTALLARLPRRAAVGGATLEVPAFCSHYGDGPLKDASLTVTLRSQGEAIAQCEAKLPEPLTPGRLHDLGVVSLQTPAAERPQAVELELVLTAGSARYTNSYELWLMPRVDRPALDDPRIVRELDAATLARIAEGESLLWLYRPAHCFGKGAPRPALDWTASRDLFKPCIWDRGHNLGALVRPHAVLDTLPHGGSAGWPLAPLIHHGCKINLDGFPAPIRPAVQGVDRPVRDRMEVARFGRSRYVPEHTFRRWGWLFDLRVGRGRLTVCGFNFDQPDPVGDWLLAKLSAALDEPADASATQIAPADLEAYLRRQAQQPLPTEPPMTAYWLRDADPVETTLFWEELGITLQ